MRTIAVVNQKGGCGKTTTTVNLAGALTADGARVLVVDLDPQAHATLALGVDPETLPRNVYDVLAEAPGSAGATSLADACVQVEERLALLPSGIVLSALEQKLAAERAADRTERLARALGSAGRDDDFVLIDCPPNLGVLTLSALRAADEALVPLETSEFALHGVEKLLETLALLGDRLGHVLAVRILPTLYDGRTRFARDTLARIRERFGDLCFDTVIRQNVRLREAARRGRPLQRFARTANGALDHAALALEVAASAPAERGAVRPAPREVVVHYRDPRARDVRIAGDFNDWIPDKDVRSRVREDGPTRVWTKVLQVPPGTYRYRYVVDGEWREDPENPGAAGAPEDGRSSVLVVR